MSSTTSLTLQSIRRCILSANKLIHASPTSIISSKIFVRHHDLLLRNVDLVVKQQLVDDRGPEVHYKTLQQLGIQTHDKQHSFNLSCDQAMKFIKMGIINKYMATQYCHYCAHLAKTLEGELGEYYANKSLELALFLGRSVDKLTESALMTILLSVCDINSTNCIKICKFLLSKQVLIDKLTTSSLSKFLSACYKYKQWSLATKLVEIVRELDLMSPSFIDNLIIGMNETAIEYNNSISITEKEKIKQQVFNHLFKLIDQFYQERIQFITKHPLELELAFQQFGVEITKNPRLKMSGKCTYCNSNLPIYDNKITQKLNSTLKNLLHERTNDELFIHTAPSDLKSFERFLVELIRKDNKPIDVVIDGLNVAYRGSNGFTFFKQKLEEDLNRTYKIRKTTNQVQVLVNTILRGDLLQKYRKILVIGRKHMSRWPGLVEFFDKNNIHYYFSADH